jgi:hypothetical protein
MQAAGRICGPDSVAAVICCQALQETVRAAAVRMMRGRIQLANLRNSGSYRRRNQPSAAGA